MGSSIIYGSKVWHFMEINIIYIIYYEQHMNTKYGNLPFSLSNITMLKIKLWQLNMYKKNYNNI